MKTKRLIIPFFSLALTGILLSGCGGKTGSTTADPDEKAGMDAAQTWLALIDQGEYAESWNEAAPVFQGAVTEGNWTNALLKVRQPLGNLVSRNLKSVQEATQLPGAPDGKYVVMQFDTSFANKQSAVETVTMGPEQNGQWKASGYYIK